MSLELTTTLLDLGTFLQQHLQMHLSKIKAVSRIRKIRARRKLQTMLTCWGGFSLKKSPRIGKVL